MKLSLLTFFEKIDASIAPDAVSELAHTAELIRTFPEARDALERLVETGTDWGDAALPPAAGAPCTTSSTSPR